MLRVSQQSIAVNPTDPVWQEGGATRKDKAIGVYSDVKVMALYLEVDDKKTLLCTLDVIALSAQDVEDLKGRIVDRVDIPKDNIIIVATHTHSAPGVRFNEEKHRENAEYKEFMFNALVDIVQASAESPEEVKAYYRTGEVHGYYGNRDAKDKDGDQQVTLITFENKDQETVAAVVNIHVHPTFLNQSLLLVSSDMAGALRKYLTEPVGVEPVFICGVTGDMSSRFYRRSQTYFELERCGQGIADEIMKFPAKEELKLDTLEVRNVEYIVDREIKISDYQEKLEQYLKQREVETNPVELRLLETKIKKAKSVIDANETRMHVEYVSSILNLGDLEIVTFNSDVVVLFGKMIKNASSKKVCITISHANGEEGYLVEKQDFNTGYIGNVTKALPGQAEEYIQKVIKNLFK